MASHGKPRYSPWRELWGRVGGGDPTGCSAHSHFCPFPILFMAPMSIPKAKKPLKIAVLGPAGFGGSYLCLELVKRGHNVTGISRSPEKLGKHELYSTVSIDLDKATIDELADAFKG